MPRKRCDGSATAAVPAQARLAWPTELGDDAIAIAPVDRPHVLDDLPDRRARDPLEDEGRRVQRNAERERLVLVRDRRLDRLGASDDLDVVLVVQQLVEREALEVGSRQPGDQRLAYVQCL